MGRTVNNNQQAFFELLRAGLWEKEARLFPFDGVDYARVNRLAQEQSVVGLVAAGLEHVQDVKVPRDVALSFAGATLQFEHRNQAMNEFVAGLIERLKAAGVEALLVKGQGIAQCYERPSWQASGDIDLLLDDENYTKAVVFLSGIAQNVEDEDAYKKHKSFVIDSWEVECHGTLRSVLWRRLDKGIDTVQADTFANGSVRVWRMALLMCIFLRQTMMWCLCFATFYSISIRAAWGCGRFAIGAGCCGLSGTRFLLSCFYAG